jgi:glucose-6-phosphate dehydrogenase assembly protein OpcA
VAALPGRRPRPAAVRAGDRGDRHRRQRQPSAELLAAWLAHALRCPVSRSRTRAGTGIVGVKLKRPGGPIELTRPEGSNVATLVQPDQPVRRVSLPHRALNECLAEELRRLDPDDVYGDVLIGCLRPGRDGATKAKGEGP